MALESLSCADLTANAHLYQVSAERGIEDGWHQRIKDFNFKTLTRIQDISRFPLSGSSVLDVGCGTGDFFPFLRDVGVGEYLGIDVLSSAVERAREKYPKGVFRHGDFLVEPSAQEPYVEHFDYVFLSGALAPVLPSGNVEFMKKMLARMGELAKIGFAFNYLTDTQQKDEGINLTYLYPRDVVVEICKELFPGLEIYLRTAQIGFDAQDTVFVIKNNA
jgi:SAM-dependent methyltransferase